MSLPGSALLDTSIVVEHFRGNPEVTGALEAAHRLFVPSVVVGELCYGALRSNDFEKRWQQLLVFLQAVLIIFVDKETAFHYGHIRSALTQAGNPIPENDIWIAALAIQHQLPLATRDSHFERIASISLLNW
jgi:tRNA(fMet)-specific endonuclease VapC